MNSYIGLGLVLAVVLILTALTVGKVLSNIQKAEKDAKEAQQNAKERTQKNQVVSAEQKDVKKTLLQNKKVWGVFKDKLAGIFSSNGVLLQKDYDFLEELLLKADVGVEQTTSIIQCVKENIQKGQEPKMALSQELEKRLVSDNKELNLPKDKKPAVIIVVGVNGVGKTTVIARLAKLLKDQNNTVLLGAADTFRAAATEQLVHWGNQLGVEVVTGSQINSTDPAAVAYKTVEQGIQENIDVVIIDTAGRLANKNNLIQELEKIYRVAGKQSSVDEVLLVLDATTGQNGLMQAKVFSEAINITGAVLTKLDGSAKGGIIIPIQTIDKIPVKFIGVGEGQDDLLEFNAKEFVSSLVP